VEDSEVALAVAIRKMVLLYIYGFLDCLIQEVICLFKQEWCWGFLWSFHTWLMLLKLGFLGIHCLSTSKFICFNYWKSIGM